MTFLGRKPRWAPGRWVGNDSYFSGLHFREVYTSLSYFAVSTFCCHIYFAGLEIEPIQIAGFSKETSLFLSDCLVIYITNECFASEM